MSSKELIQLLQEAGFEFISSRGSHCKYRKDDVTVIVPHPRKDLKKGTEVAILRQAGIHLSR